MIFKLIKTKTRMIFNIILCNTVITHQFVILPKFNTKLKKGKEAMHSYNKIFNEFCAKPH